MRLRFALIAVLIAGALFIAPATASAGSNKTWTVLKNVCTNSGGAYGYGYSIFKVRLYEWGQSGTAQFRVKAWAQYDYGSWVSVDSWNYTYSVWFGNTSESKYYNKKYTYHWGSDHASYYSRLKVRAEWLNSSGQVIAYKVLNARIC